MSECNNPHCDVHKVEGLHSKILPYFIKRLFSRSTKSFYINGIISTTFPRSILVTLHWLFGDVEWWMYNAFLWNRLSQWVQLNGLSHFRVTYWKLFCGRTLQRLFNASLPWVSFHVDPLKVYWLTCLNIPLSPCAKWRGEITRSI